MKFSFVDKDAETEFEIIILGCSNTDFDDEYPTTQQVQLINGDWVNKEYLNVMLLISFPYLFAMPKVRYIRYWKWN